MFTLPITALLILGRRRIDSIKTLKQGVLLCQVTIKINALMNQSANNTSIHEHVGPKQLPHSQTLAWVVSFPDSCMGSLIPRPIFLRNLRPHQKIGSGQFHWKNWALLIKCIAPIRLLESIYVITDSQLPDYWVPRLVLLVTNVLVSFTINTYNYWSLCANVNWPYLIWRWCLRCMCERFSPGTNYCAQRKCNRA